MDKATLGGILLALGGMLLGLMIEGGNLSQILQPTAAMIVLGGTLGAVLIQYPLPIAIESAKRLANVFVQPEHDAQSRITLLVAYANRARREGIISLDKEIDTIQKPFTPRPHAGNRWHGVAGTSQDYGTRARQQRGTRRKDSPVFESAGGFSPTIGIIGAILGLIQVMQHLDKIDEVGRGIAVAFVATIYGVGLANLFFLPVAGKLRIRIREEQIIREMTLEGVISILEGMNPRMLEATLRGFLYQARESEVRDASAKT